MARRDGETPREGRTCFWCAHALDGGRCGHRTHARFQREPNVPCALYRYSGPRR